MKLQQMKNVLSRRAQKGVTMIEYALIAALIAVVAIFALTSIGENLNTKFTAVSNSLK